MAEDSMLQQVIEALQAGETKRAKDLLTRMIKATPSNADYWVWMSAVVESPRERTYCLQEALKADPQNQAARRGLVISGGLPREAMRTGSTGMVYRKWSVRQPTPRQTIKIGPGFPLPRMLLYSAGGFVAIGLLLFGIFGAKPPPAAPVPTHKPPPTLEPSATLLPTNTMVVRTIMPTFVGPTPLWMLLPATYTPTPFYGATEHPRTEAYRAGKNSYDRSEWEAVINYMQQVIVNEPYAGDAYYYMGEAYRNQGDFKQALSAFDKAVEVDSKYAPAYLGRARASHSNDPNRDVSADVQKAIELDPTYGEAYLFQAQLALERQDIPAALSSVAEAEALIPASPWVYVYEAQANLAQGHVDEAVNQARKANQLDRTLLISYRVLAEALQASGKDADSLEYIGTYLLFASQDAPAQVMLAKAYLGWEKPDQAILALDAAIAADDHLISAYLMRGELYMKQENPQRALEDFQAALQIDPGSWPAIMDAAQVMLAVQDYQDAYQLFRRSAEYAQSDAQLAGLYYWRAQVYEKLEYARLATQDWEALLALPADALQPGWLEAAQQHLGIEVTATPTPAPEMTPTP